MADGKAKIGYGEKANLAGAIESGKLDTHDIAITIDDDSLAYVDADGNAKFVKDNDAQEKIADINTKIGEIPDGKTIKDYIDGVAESGMTITLF